VRDVNKEYFEKKEREQKPPLQKISPAFIEGMARVAHMGDKKHADTHWTLGLPWSAVMGAVKRHIALFEKGEVMDLESGENHLLHAAVGLMFLHYYCEHAEAFGVNNDLLFWEE
jgi:hypothetical protein